MPWSNDFGIFYPSIIELIMNVYDYKYYDYVNTDEMERGTKRFNDARNPLQSGIVTKPAESYMFAEFDEESDTKYFKSISGNKIKMTDFKHNNMQPFIKGKVKQNIDFNNHKVERDTGTDRYYKKKEEVENFFQPISDIKNPNQNDSAFFQQRVNITNKYNNTLPFEQVRVGPGLNMGYTSCGCGGFQQSDTLEYVMPKKLEELRPLSNQKESTFRIPVQGPAMKTEQRGIVKPFAKNKPEKTYARTSDNWFRTTGAIVKDSERPEIAMKATVRPETQVEYRGAPVSEYMKGTGDNDDYGKNNIITYDNERDETQKRTVISNITCVMKAMISPISDILKLTNKLYLVDAPRAGGNPQAQIPNKLQVQDDIVRTTVRETTVQDSENLNLTGADGTYSALEDTAKTTVKETTVQDSENLNLTGADGTYTALEDTAKTTVKETILQDSDNLNLTGADGIYTALDDTPKTTVKETTVQDSENLNLAGPDGTYSSLEDIAKTTVKETLIHDSDNLNLTGPDGTYSSLEDIAKTTVKETLIHDSDNINIKCPTNMYAKNNDRTKTTTKETLPVQDQVRNIGKGTYRVYVYDPDLHIKTTVKETTITNKSANGFIGGFMNSILGAYASIKVLLPITNKQSISNSINIGSACSVNAKKQINRDAKVKTNGVRETLFLNAGYTPNAKGANEPLDKSDINFKTNKVMLDSLAQRDKGNVNFIYQRPPELNLCAMTKDNNKKDVFADRLDGTMVCALKNNDYNISINPICCK